MRDDVAHGTATNLDRTIENPVTGERFTFLTTAEETDGELLKIKAEIPAGTPGVPLHYHLTFTEGFEVLEGRLDLRVGEDHLVLSSGESLWCREVPRTASGTLAANPPSSRPRLGPRARWSNRSGRWSAWRGAGRPTRREFPRTSSISPYSTSSLRAT